MRLLGKELSFKAGRGFGLIRCQGGCLRVEAARPGVMRLGFSPDGRFPARRSPLLAPGAIEGGAVRVLPGKKAVEAAGLRLELKKGALAVYGSGGRRLLAGSAEGSLRSDDRASGFRLAMPADARYYGFGEKAGKLDKRGTRMTMWNADIFGNGIRREMHPESTHVDPMYASIPFFIERSTSGASHGLFVATGARCHFDLGLDDGATLGFSAEERALDLYVIDGPEMADVVRRYTELTGRHSMPPLWALGFHQCRWSYETRRELEAVARGMRRHRVPCDALWMDIDYMDGFRIFTYHRGRFPGARRMVEALGERGFRAVAIVDPGFKADPKWDLYREGLKKGYFFKEKNGQVYRGEVWPGDTVFPDFRKPEAAAWFGRLVSEFADRYGLAGIWFDMNEPSDQKDQLANPVHLACGNLYPHLELSGAAAEWDRRHPHSRRFFLTRAAAAGSQRHSAIWTGDNCSRWEHIEMSVGMSANLGLSGFAFVGSDVGGFGENTSGELLARWTQYGALTPFFRNHAAKGTKHQEPWSFGPKILAICREYTRLRYRLLPYIYSAFRQAVETGLPVQRPMILAFPRDGRFVNEARQYMFGDHLLVAPVTAHGAVRKGVVLPAGRWVDLDTGEIHEGGGEVWKPAPLERMPVLVRAGAPIPTWPAAESTAWIDRTRLRVECFPGGAAATELYEDDGETRAHERGEWGKVWLDHSDGKRLRVFRRGPTEGRYRVPGRTVEVVFRGCVRKPRRVRLLRAGRDEPAKWVWSRKTGEAVVRVVDTPEGFKVSLLA
ncbi:MAG TPA: glycoside hydrolase family 31 protein [Planctomycetota bacterium]|nr:glycoside hydrolase family 31 protein [Planctomycetota bacterium]